MSENVKVTKQIELSGSEIAIIGISCRFPGARNHYEFWDNLCRGVESIRSIKDEELISEGVSLEMLKNPNYVKAASILEDYDKFDAHFFGYTSKEAELMDPQQRLFLECAWGALEDAGYNPENYSGSIGVYGGAKTNTYLFNISSNREQLKSLDTFQIALGNDLGCLSTRVSYKLDLKGPSYALHTACSTSLVAVHLAYQSLLIDECQMAIAGGVTVNVPHKVGYLYQPGGIMSPDGHCRAFDARAAGTVFGSGAGIVVLKRLEDAMKDRDHIYAVIKGSAVNNDGSKKASYAAPGVEGQTCVIMEALANAGLEADSISYVETHGTGTNLGDPIEIMALTNAFRASTSKKGFCSIGSVKSNVGHLDAAAGICSLIKAVLCLDRGFIPPSLYYEQPNPQIDFDGSPFYVNAKLTEWRHGDLPRRAGVSSFGFGSTNAHVIVEEAPVHKKLDDSRAHQLLLLSARTEAVLEKMADNLAAYLCNNIGIDLADAAYTLGIGRKIFKYRKVILCKNKDEAVKYIKTNDSEHVFDNCEDRVDRAFTVFLPADDIPYVNMGRELYEEESVFKEHFDLCSSYFKLYIGIDLRNTVYPSKGKENEALQLMNQDRISCSAVFSVVYAFGKMLLEWGICPDRITGAGMGEYIAKCLSSIMQLEDAIEIAADGKFSKGVVQEPEENDCVYLRIGIGNNGDRSTEKHNGRTGNLNMISCMLADRRLVNLENAIAAFGRLWLLGVHINWDRYYGRELRSRVSLPAYPFEGLHYWISPGDMNVISKASVTNEASNKRLVKKENVENWFYKPVWYKEQIHSPEMNVCLNNGRCCWLIFNDNQGIGRRVSDKLINCNQDVINVEPGDGFVWDGKDRYIIDPSSSQDYQKLVSSLEASHKTPDRILHMWSLTSILNNNHGSALFDKCQTLGAYSLIHLVQAIGSSKITKAISLFVITKDIHAVTGGEDICPERSTILGPCRVIPQEYSNISCNNIDISVAENQDSIPDGLIDKLICEFISCTNAMISAYRDGERWIQDYEAICITGNNSNNIRIRDGGVYLITGGLGDIGLTFAESISSSVKAKLVLLSRSSMPSRDNWEYWLKNHDETDVASIRIKRIFEIESTGSEVLICSADVADEDQMRHVVELIRSQFGEINGVVHTAGITGAGMYKPIQNTDTELCNLHFNAKVHGLYILDRIFAQTDIDFMILTSSLSSILGGLWNAAYSASGIFMDTYAIKKNSDKWLSVNWDSWHKAETKEKGASDIGRTLSEYAISHEEGKKAFNLILSSSLSGQISVSTGDLQERLNRWVRIKSAEQDGGSANKTGKTVAAEIPMQYSIKELKLKIAEIWKNVLGIKSVGNNDNFFDIGGNSISGLQLISEVKREFGVQINPVSLYEMPTISALAENIGLKAADDGSSMHKTCSGKEDIHTEAGDGKEVAIIGMALRFPKANNIDEFWDNLVNGRECISFFSDDELKASDVDDSLLGDPNYIKARFIIDNAEYFDASFFGYNPGEAEILDPQHRVFMECTWEALENAGYDPDKYDDPIGIFAGTSISTYLFHLYKNPDMARSIGDMQAIIGNDKDSLTTAVSYKLNLRGPSISVQTFCSTSLVGVHLACKSLINGECKMALAGGSSINVPQVSGYMYQEGSLFSPDGHCRAFDIDANGTVFGNGVGVVVLKRLKDAIADGDNIYAVIKGSAINNDGSLKAGYTAPSVEGQARVIKDAITTAGVDAGTIGYLEAHGTGTQMGDLIELTALGKAFGSLTDRKSYCAIGSVKTNTGHMDRASGVAGLIKAALALKNDIIPPTLNFSYPNTKIDFENSPFYVCDSLIKWPSGSVPKRAGISSLGFGGTNVHIILEEAPETGILEYNKQPILLLLSARTESALRAAAANLADFFRRNPSSNLADIAYTLQVGRRSFDYRIAMVCHNIGEAIDLLEQAQMEQLQSYVNKEIKKPVIFAYPGLFTQNIGMGADIYHNERLFRENFDECADIVGKKAGIDLCKLMYQDESKTKNESLQPEDSELYIQLSLFTFKYSLYKTLTELGVQTEKTVFCGINGLAASCATGISTINDAISDIINGNIPADDKQELVDILDIMVILDGSTGYGGFLNYLGSLWENGMDICWSKRYVKGERNRVPLPSYPFERQCFWVQPAKHIGVSVDASRMEMKKENFLYLHSWKRSGKLKAFNAGNMWSESKTWLLFVDKNQISHDIIRCLNEEKQEVIIVWSGSEFNKKDIRTYSINPASSRDYYLLMEDIRASGKKPDNAIHTWACSQTQGGNTMSKLLDHYQNIGFYSILWLARCFSELYPKRHMNIWVLSYELQEIYGVEELCPEKSTVAGACSFINTLYPEIDCHCIDMEIEMNYGSGKNSSGFALGEIFYKGNDPIVGHRGGYRWLPELEPLNIDKENASEMPVKDGGTYIIINAFEGDGMAFSRYLASVVKANQVLVHSSVMPPEDQWKEWLITDHKPDADQEALLLKEVAGNGISSLDADKLYSFIENAQNKIEDAFKVLKTPAGLDQDLNLLCSIYIYQYIDKCVNMHSKRIFSFEDLKKYTGVNIKFEKFLKYMISELEKDGLISIDKGNITFMRDAFEPASTKLIKEDFVRKYPEFADGFSALDHCASSYKQALSGEVETVSVLYPEGSSDMIMSVTRNQDRFSNVGLYRGIIADALCRIESECTGRKLKILEIGAGDGKLTWEIAVTLTGKNVEYYFTDIGKSFIINAENKASREGLDFMRFSTLDIMKDPISQGFDLFSFDIILALDVVHATPDIRKSMESLKRLLVPGGLMLLMEATRSQRWVNMIWGLAEGWWYFSDSDLRRDSPLMSPNQWRTVLCSMEFDSVRVYPFDTYTDLDADHSLIIVRQPLKISGDAYMEWYDKRIKKEMNKVHDRIQHLLKLGQNGSAPLSIYNDIIDEEQISRVISDSCSRFGRIDGVVYVLKQRLETVHDTTGKLDAFEHSKIVKNEASNLYKLQDALRDLHIDFAAILSPFSFYKERELQAADTQMSLFANCFADNCSRAGNIKWIIVEADLQAGKAIDFSSDSKLQDHRNQEYGNINDYELYENENERLIAGIWSEVLGISNIRRTDSFFEIGGDSLQATQLNSRLRRVFNVELTMQGFFKAPTIRETAETIERILDEQHWREEIEILSMLENLTDEEVEKELIKRKQNTEQLTAAVKEEWK